MRPFVTPRGPGARIRQLVRDGAYGLSYNAPASGDLTVRWRAGHTVIARATRQSYYAGQIEISVRLTAAGRRLLSRTRTRLSIAATAHYAVTDGPQATVIGPRATASATATLRR